MSSRVLPLGWTLWRGILMVLDTPRATDSTRNRHLARVGLKYKDDILDSHRLELWIC